MHPSSLASNTPLTLQGLFGLQGRKALVTGAGRGIGAAIAEGLAAAGAHVLVHDVSLESCRETCERINADGGSSQALAVDLSGKGQGRELMHQAIDLAGGLDILVINAAAQVNASLAELTEEDLELQWTVNFRSMIDMLSICLPLMAEKGWGRVVNIGSINQLYPKPIVTAYAAIKAAQHNLIQSQAREYAKTGVLLNTLAPGLVDTQRNDARREQDPEAWQDYLRQLNWMGRAGQVSEMVGAAILLSSDACSFMTGERIVMAGGT